MSANPPPPRAADLAAAVAAHVPTLTGVAHLAPGWRDLIAGLPAPAILRHPDSHRASGVRVTVRGPQVEVEVALVIAWPHQARAVCETTHTEVATLITRLADTDSCQVRVAVRDIHIDTTP